MGSIHTTVSVNTGTVVRAFICPCSNGPFNPLHVLYCNNLALPFVSPHCLKKRSHLISYYMAESGLAYGIKGMGHLSGWPGSSTLFCPRGVHPKSTIASSKAAIAMFRGPFGPLRDQFFLAAQPGWAMITSEASLARISVATMIISIHPPGPPSKPTCNDQLWARCLAPRPQLLSSLE